MRLVLIWLVLVGVLGAVADSLMRVHPGFGILFVAAFVVPTLYVKRLRDEESRFPHI